MGASRPSRTLARSVVSKRGEGTAVARVLCPLSCSRQHRPRRCLACPLVRRRPVQDRRREVQEDSPCGSNTVSGGAKKTHPAAGQNASAEAVDGSEGRVTSDTSGGEESRMRDNSCVNRLPHQPGLDMYVTSFPSRTPVLWQHRSHLSQREYRRDRGGTMRLTWPMDKRRPAAWVIPTPHEDGDMGTGARPGAGDSSRGASKTFRQQVPETTVE